MKILLAASAAALALGAASSAQAANLVQTGVIGDGVGTAVLPGAPWDPRPHRVTLEADLTKASSVALYGEIFFYFEIVSPIGPGIPPDYHSEGYHFFEDYSANLTPTGFSFILDTRDDQNCNPFKPSSYYCDHEYLDRFYLEVGTTDGPIEYTYKITAIPEPATWALMIGGFGAAGAMLRRRAAAWG